MNLGIFSVLESENQNFLKMKITTSKTCLYIIESVIGGGLSQRTADASPLIYGKDVHLGGRD